MMVVVDANVLVSSLLTRSASFEVFLLNRIFKRFEFLAPEFLLAELEKHKEELIKESRLSSGEFDEVLEFLLEDITFVPASQFSDRLPEARKLLSAHNKDEPYLALSLKLDSCPIFSGDKAFKAKSPVQVLSPRELLDKMSGKSWESPE
ncbi:MAG: PIN domain-containing protein [Candidatus Woesearchaeota archaeon]